MNRRTGSWVRCMVAFALALVMAAGGLPAQGIAYALDNNEEAVPTTVGPQNNTEWLNEKNLPVGNQPGVALEHEEEITLVQKENPEAVAYITKDGTYTAYDNINAALQAWSGQAPADAFTGDVRLTLLEDVTGSVAAPISFTTSGKKTLSLNGHTATLTAGENYNGSALIYVGQDTENSDTSPSSAINVNLVIEDSSGTGEIVCNNIDTVIKVSGYNRGFANDCSSSLELRGGTISGGMQNTIALFGNGAHNASKYSAKFEMTGGTVQSCAGTTDEESGYGVRLYGNALFDMNGGAICENAKGGVYLKKYNYSSGSDNFTASPLLTMHGGTISNNKTEGVCIAQGGTYVGGNFTMYGGTISGNGTDGVLMEEDANFTMHSGTITSNTANGVNMANDSAFTMDGGTISNNGDAGVAINSKDNYENSYATFTMTGGEITGNATGVLVNQNLRNVFNLEGSPKILGNGSADTACNVQLEGAWETNSPTVTKTGQLIRITGPLATPADGPQIGVTKPVDGTDVYFTAGYATHHQSTDPATFFRSDALTVKTSGGGKTGNAYICWHLGENDEGTGPLNDSDCEAARVAHTHIWEPVYQYTLSLNKGTLEYDHKENVLTVQCFNALANKKAIKHGACPNVASATLTLSAQSKEYDGTPVVATLTESEGWKAENPFGYDASKIEYFKKDGTALSGAPKEVGDYVAKFKLDGIKSADHGVNTKYDHISTSFSITPHVDPPTPPVTINNDVSYSAHCQTYAWNAPSGSNGTTAGTTGQAKRLEALTIKLADKSAGSIEYRSHLQGNGWESGWAKDGGQSGTTGQARRIEAIQVRLTGERAKSNSVWYRVHSQTFGWMGWAKNGEPAGTTGMGKRAEAYQVVVLPNGQTPKDYNASAPAFRSFVAGNAHVQSLGWTGNRFAGTIGTTGQAKRLEGITLTLPAGLTDVYAGGIAYEAHVQAKGWLGEVANGALAGTTGQAKRMEAVKIHLTGDISKHFSVWYRVHSQTFGWGGWAKDGDPAGTTGLAKRAEAVEVVILPVGTEAPGSTTNAIR